MITSSIVLGGVQHNAISNAALPSAATVFSTAYNATHAYRVPTPFARARINWRLLRVKAVFTICPGAAHGGDGRKKKTNEKKRKKLRIKNGVININEPRGRVNRTGRAPRFGTPSAARLAGRARTRLAVRRTRRQLAYHTLSLFITVINYREDYSVETTACPSHARVCVCVCCGTYRVSRARRRCSRDF